MWRKVVIAALALPLIGCAGALGDPEPPEVSIAGLGIGQPGLFEQELRVDLRLQNPNDFAIPVDSLHFALEVNEVPFARGQTSGDFELPALGETVVPVTVLVSTTDLMDRVMRLGAEQRLDYQLTGTAELGNLFGMSLPFERSGRLALPNLTGAPEPEAEGTPGRDTPGA